MKTGGTDCLKLLLASEKIKASKQIGESVFVGLYTDGRKWIKISDAVEFSLPACVQYSNVKRRKMVYCGMVKIASRFMWKCQCNARETRSDSKNLYSIEKERCSDWRQSSRKIGKWRYHVSSPLLLLPGWSECGETFGRTSAEIQRSDERSSSR